jgi:NAD(P)-dependent dehydrogenase (short-subunit alcohol dehydrogenase family)
MGLFDGRVALVTGGSSGIGRATAARLAKMGASIAVAARNQAALDEVAAGVRAGGGQALAVPTDVSDAEQCRQAVEKTVAQFGRLDVLLCAAGLSMRAYFDGSDLSALERIVRVNLLGTMYMTYHALPHVKASRGSLVAVSSMTGKRGIPSYAVYGASKFGIQGLYESLRVELRPAGVHVGVVSPAFVDTPLRENVLGPDGKPWSEPPPPPFRIWPLEKCVDRIVRLIVKRRREACLPAFAGPLVTLDQVLGKRIGDFILGWAFPRELH